MADQVLRFICFGIIEVFCVWNLVECSHIHRQFHSFTSNLGTMRISLCGEISVIFTHVILPSKWISTILFVLVICLSFNVFTFFMDFLSIWSWFRLWWTLLSTIRIYWFLHICFFFIKTLWVCHRHFLQLYSIFATFSLLSLEYSIFKY